MILVTQFFSKSLRKLRSVSLSSIIEQAYRHKSWLDNLIEIWQVKGYPIMKGYLNAKKVRIVYVLQTKDGYYIPFYIVRKETKVWKNITKDTIPELVWDLEKVMLDIRNDDFEELEI